MASPSLEAVETFMRITGASQSIALRKLEEYRGNINAAVNAFLSEGYNYNSYHATHHDNQARQRGLLPFLNAIRSFRLPYLLDPNYRRHYLNQIRGSSSIGLPMAMSNSPPGGTRPVPPEFNNLPAQRPQVAQRRTFENESPTSSSSNQEIGRDMEDEMLKAAIEASKQNSSELELLQRYHQQEEDLAHAVSLSLKVAKEEKEIRELLENKDEEPILRMGRKEHGHNEPKECRGDTSFHHQQEECAFNSQEWGGITFSEFNESVLLEAALFGDVSERSLDDSRPVSDLQNDKIPGTSTGSNLQPIPCLPSSSTATVQSQRKKEEVGRVLSAQDDTVTLLLRMPDGSRHECCFLKSDKLELLFHFIDEKMAMKPGTYRVVRPYPRWGFGVEDGSMMLRELGLTGKQEALFLELI